jgi:GxxExxY protein
MNVHKTLGNGFQEVIYQRCLAIELGKAGLSEAKVVWSTNSFSARNWDLYTFNCWIVANYAVCIKYPKYV